MNVPILPTHHDLIGRRIQSRWFVQDSIHIGQFESTYQAIDTKNARVVFLKVLCTDDVKLHSRFLQETFILKLMSNPHVVSLLENGYCKTHDVHFMVLNWVPGHTLEDVMRVRKTYPFRTIYRHLLQTLQGLQTIHDHKIIHRGLTPKNILLDTQHRNACVSGFRVSKVTEQNVFRITRDGEICGIPHYLAPEQIIHETLSPQTDLYAFGVILFEAITGRLPYTSENLGVLCRDHLYSPIPDPEEFWSLQVPFEPILAELVSLLLNKAPHRRPESAKAVYTLLREIAERRPDLMYAPLESYPDAPSRDLFQHEDISSVSSSDS